MLRCDIHRHGQISLDQLISPPKQILIFFFLRDRVAPARWDELVVRVVHAGCGSLTADRAMGQIRTALLLIDALGLALGEHVVASHVHCETAVHIIDNVLMCHPPPLFTAPTAYSSKLLPPRNIEVHIVAGSCFDCRAQWAIPRIASRCKLSLLIKLPCTTGLTARGVINRILFLTRYGTDGSTTALPLVPARHGTRLPWV